MVVSLDRGVGQILQALRDTKQYENTIVVFTSDNGATDVGGIENLSKPFRGWKCTLFEDRIHVPFFLATHVSNNVWIGDKDTNNSNGSSGKLFTSS